MDWEIFFIAYPGVFLSMVDIRAEPSVTSQSCGRMFLSCLGSCRESFVSGSTLGRCLTTVLLQESEKQSRCLFDCFYSS